MFKFRKNTAGFEARSTSRDTATDAARAKLVLDMLNRVLLEIEAEKSGLQNRLATSIALASMTIGNDTDEYVNRDKSRDDQQSALNADIRYAEHRIGNLSKQIERYRATKQLCTDDRLGKSFIDLQFLMKA